MYLQSNEYFSNVLQQRSSTDITELQDKITQQINKLQTLTTQCNNTDALESVNNHLSSALAVISALTNTQRYNGQCQRNMHQMRTTRNNSVTTQLRRNISQVSDQLTKQTSQNFKQYEQSNRN